jgi:hypothetical protein
MTDTEFRRDVQTAINRASKENGSNTPDFILADYLAHCLQAYDRAVTAREKWYGREVVGMKAAPAPTTINAPNPGPAPDVMEMKRRLAEIEEEANKIWFVTGHTKTGEVHLSYERAKAFNSLISKITGKPPGPPSPPAPIPGWRA